MAAQAHQITAQHEPPLAKEFPEGDAPRGHGFTFGSPMVFELVDGRASVGSRGQKHAALLEDLPGRRRNDAF